MAAPDFMFPHFANCLTELNKSIKKKLEVEEERIIRRQRAYHVVDCLYHIGMKGRTFTETQGYALGPLLFWTLHHLVEYGKEELEVEELTYPMCRQACTVRSALEFLTAEDNPYKNFRAWDLPRPPLVAIEIAVQNGSSVEQDEVMASSSGGILGMFITWYLAGVDLEKFDNKLRNLRPPNYDAEKYALTPTPHTFHPATHFWWRKLNKDLTFTRAKQQERIREAMKRVDVTVVDNL